MADVSAQRYVDSVLLEVRPHLLDRVRELADRGTELPEPRVWQPRSEEDREVAGLGPFYYSAGARHQLGGITKQALDSRRTHESVLAMRAGDGQWLYPAWQFTGDGRVHGVLAPVLKALRGLDRWAAGVWLVSAHPDLDGSSPREALRAGADADSVAMLAQHDKTALVA